MRFRTRTPAPGHWFVRRVVAAIAALALIASSFTPRAAGAMATTDRANALRLLDSGCGAPVQVAQAVTGTVPVESPSPSSSSSGAPAPPHAAAGPQQLIPPPLATATPAVTPPPVPTPTPSPTASAGPVFVQRASPRRPAARHPLVDNARTGAPPRARREPLGPNQYVVLADEITGANKPGAPADLDGNVNVLYADGVLVAEHAHYDGVRYIDMTGHPYIRNRADDSILHAESIRFDTRELESGPAQRDRTNLPRRRDRAPLLQSAHAHGEQKRRDPRRSCVVHHLRPPARGLSHRSKNARHSIPATRAIARDAMLFLGGFAVFFLPIVVIPLTHVEGVPGRQTGFLPIIGYSQTEGFYVKAQDRFRAQRHVLRLLSDR